jgi:hypothetical protein
LGEVCRKLETEEEKVLPFYKETVTENEVNDLQGRHGGRDALARGDTSLASACAAPSVSQRRLTHIRISTCPSYSLAEAEARTEEAMIAAEQAGDAVEAFKAEVEAAAAVAEEEEAREFEDGDEFLEPEDMAGAAAEGAMPLSETRAAVRALSESKRRGPPLAQLPGPTDLHAVAYDQHNRRVDTYDAMDNFWKRYNKVLLDKLAVDRERQMLEAENLELRAILKQYLDGA